MESVNNKKKPKIIFFFPYYHSGGAERVHAKVVNCLSGKKNIIFITDRSRDRRFKKEFQKSARCFRLFGIQNKIRFINYLYVVLFSFFINRQNNTVLVGSKSRFYYSLVPRIKKEIPRYDIIHWLDGLSGKMALENTEFIDKRIVITPAVIGELKRQYEKTEINNKYLNRIVVIENSVQVPSSVNKNFESKLKVIFIGRDSYEKRPELAVKVWKKLKDNNDIEFFFIGRGISRYFKPSELDNVVIENINSDVELNKIYKKVHVIYLTSIFEGFPMVFMEAMSYGVVPISPAVGGVPNHLQHCKNGLLVQETNEQVIVEKIAEYIKLLARDHAKLKQLSENSYHYAKNNFLNKDFCNKYHSVIQD